MKNIEKKYPCAGNQIKALKNINLSVEYGEFIAIVGTSGSGKTTLMNMIGCLDTPSSGEYILENELVSEMSEAKLSKIRNKTIGFIFQGFNLISSLDALENVELPLIYRGIPKIKRRELAKKALEQVGLSQRHKHKPSQLSGGQQQKVAIARAIAGNPRIILADEPTGNLDASSSETILKVICSLRDKSRTIILISHDNSIAEKADRIMTMSDGMIDNSRQIINNSFYGADNFF
ncbi:MAG: ABC transporter ATP-binding protein [Oscillospiraceae bacterium]|jgi:putative ABC transport system ATP-binding protein|nr:ABC transporter ATP-binding protein [Oscillospiraceae bacterium]